jgi:nitric oxide dioxygenase
MASGADQSVSKCPFPHALKQTAPPAGIEYCESAKVIAATLPNEIDAETAKVINATAAAVVANITNITTTFYPIMFSRYPATRDYFNPAHQVSRDGLQAQPLALGTAIVKYVGLLSQPKEFKEAIELAAQKHCSLGVRAQHYPIVYECFMEAVANVLGEAVTPEVGAAWGKVVLFIARAFIEREIDIYTEKMTTSGGWFGFKEFKVVEKNTENDFISSFVFKPVDEQPLPPYQSGQFTTVKLQNVEGASPTCYRNYSLSQKSTADAFRISVKREAEGGRPAGKVSNHLHDNIKIGDTVELGMPYGSFAFEDKGTTNIFIAGGIGITPLMSMFQDITHANPARNSYFFHAVRNAPMKVFEESIKDIASKSSGAKYMSVLSEPGEKDVCHFKGFVDVESLKRETGDDFASSHYWICGPTPMMSKLIPQLSAAGIPNSQLHFECFGPLSADLKQFTI